MQNNLHVWGMKLPSAKEAKEQAIRIQTEALLKKAQEDAEARESALKEVSDEVQMAIARGATSCTIPKHIHWSIREVLQESGYEFSFEHDTNDGWPYTLIKWNG